MRIFISTRMQRQECGVVEPYSGTVGLVMRDYLFVPNLAYANNTRTTKQFHNPHWSLTEP